MATSNSAYIHSVEGRLKMACIAMALIVTMASFLSFFLSDYVMDRDEHKPDFTGPEIRSLWREFILMGASALAAVFSLCNLFLHYRSKEFYFMKRTGIIDFFYHWLMFALLIGGAGLTLVSAVRLGGINCTGLAGNGCQQFSLKVAAAGLALVAGAVYAVTGSVVLTNSKDKERELLKDEF